MTTTRSSAAVSPAPRQRSALLRAGRTWAIVCLLQASALAWSVGGLASTPFANLVSDLLDWFHAEERACGVALDPRGVCFAVEPGQVAWLADVLETFVDESAGAWTLGAWSSANGAHRVEILLPDETWGSLELWLVERPDRRVEGWFERLPRRRP